MNLKRINDDSYIDDFALEILSKKRAICPKTGLWVVDNDRLYNKGILMSELSTDFVEALGQVKQSLKSMGLI